MLERRLRDVTTLEGVRIAYWTLGFGGHPLVYLASGPWAHVELWDAEECRAWYRRLAAGRTLAGYDLRGTGSSQRDVHDLSPEAHLRDLESVVDARGLESFDLFAAADAGALGVAYAARHPKRVSRLILWCSWVRGADLALSPRLRAWRTLLDHDWDLFTDTCTQLALGWSSGEVARRSAEQLRRTVTPELLRTAFAAADSADASPLLGHVRAPTLVAHRRGITWLPPEIARETADAIPNAELVFLDGDSTAPYAGDTAAAFEAVEQFLAGRSGGPLRSSNGGVSKAREPDLPDGLTPREAEVLRLVAIGRTNQEIADELVLSLRTVEHHLTNVYGKTAMRRKPEAAAYALMHGLV